MSRWYWWRRLRGGTWYLVLRPGNVSAWTKRPRALERILAQEPG